MAPVTDKIIPKRTNDDESDEGFVSPSVDRIGLRNRKDSVRQVRKSESESGSSSSSDNDSQVGSSSATTTSESSQGIQNSDEEMEDRTIATGTKPCIDEGASNATGKPNAETSSSSPSPVTPSATAAAVTAKDPEVDSKGETLAKFIVFTLLDKRNGDTSDKVERTLLRVVKMMMQKHEILFKGMMKRLQVTRETGYISFVTVANTLFEEDKGMEVTWSRIVALYAFGGQLALYCKEKGMDDFACTVADFIGKYYKEKLTPYVTYIGGWNTICEVFPEEIDLENKVRRVLSWTAVGLGVAATLSYLTSR